MIPTAHVLACSAALFFVGAVGALSRRNLLVVLMSILLMGNAVHLSLTGFARSFAGQGEAPLDGQVLAILAIVVGAAETAVALGILVALVRNRDSLDAEDASLLKW